VLDIQAPHSRRNSGSKRIARSTASAPRPTTTTLAAAAPRRQFEAAPSATTDIVHVFETERARLAKQLTALRKKLAPDATVWSLGPRKHRRFPHHHGGHDPRVGPAARLRRRKGLCRHGHLVRVEALIRKGFGRSS